MQESRLHLAASLIKSRLPMGEISIDRRDRYFGRSRWFGLNGLVATAIHYIVLVVLVEGAGVSPISLATIIAANCGITASYLGNRSFVMRARVRHREAISRFLVCYTALIVVHGTLMALWADRAGLDYNIGFVLFTAIAAGVTYLLNRFCVFRFHPQESSPRTSESAGR